MMHTIIDLAEVYDGRVNTDEKLENNFRNVISFDAMRLLHFNGG